MKVIAYLTTVLSLVACGSDKGGKATETVAVTEVSPTTGTEATTISKAYATASVLPSCTTAIEGQLAYIKSSKTFQTCEAGTWVTIDTTTTKTVEVLKAVSNVTCFKSVTNAQAVADGLTGAPASGFNLSYTITDYSNGMRSVEAAVAYGLLQSGATSIYTAEQGGYAQAKSSAIVMDEVSPANGGFWGFAKDGQASQPYTATYNDGDLTGLKTRKYVYLAAECQLTTY